MKQSVFVIRNMDCPTEALIVLRPAAVAHHRGGSDELQFGR